MQELQAALEAAGQKLFDVDIAAELTRPDEKFGDYASNAALQLAKQLGRNPREVAEALAGELKNQALLANVTVAGPGFLNFKLTDEALARAAFAATSLPKPLAGKEILVEFGDPNPFKEMHIGHLYSLIVGDAIASLLDANGASVRRLGYHGDVGRHVAMAIWGMQNNKGSIGECYAAGAKAYEENEKAKTEIQAINEHIYKKDDAEINKLYDEGRSQSLAGFEQIYQQLGVKYDHDYFESESSSIGVKLVEDHRNVFKTSDGAIVYEGEKAGLHTRVFITSKGLPTYETKDLGLAELKNRDYPDAARSIIITANEQSEYFKVMLAALTEIDPTLAKKTTHLSHGFVNLSTGKMSSRSGDVYTGATLIDAVDKAAKEQFPDSAPANRTPLAALKYDFLKSRLGGDITFDVAESVSLEGNSGPYLQYAHARARSILGKAKTGNRGEGIGDSDSYPLPTTHYPLEPGERGLARKISEYPEVIAKATAELMPHHVTTYLYELAQAFNRFYEGNRVIGHQREAARLGLVEIYADVLRHGLGLLNIATPDKM